MYHVGNAHDMLSIIQRGLIPGGKSLKRHGHSVFFTAVNPMYTYQHQEEVQYDMDKPRMAVYKNTWKFHRLQKKCTAKCINLRGYREEPCSRRSCIMDVRIFPIPKARTSADHQCKRSEEYEETRSAKFEETRGGNIDFSQFDTHPNRDSLMEDLHKTEEFNQFSAKSKELISSIGNTEYFELCEIFAKMQCPDCSLYWEAGIVYCTCGKCLQPSERNRQLNKVRCDVLSIPGYVIDMDQLCGRTSTTTRTTCSRKPRRNSAVLFWKGGITLISTEVLCLKLSGLKKP